MTQEEDIKKAVECMRKGGVILYPTDTVWGIGCDATNPEAVKKVYEIKKRDDSKAMICLIDSDSRISRYIRNVPDVAWDLFNLATKPTTIILDGAQGLAPNLIAEDVAVHSLHHCLSVPLQASSLHVYGICTDWGSISQRRMQPYWEWQE